MKTLTDKELKQLILIASKEKDTFNKLRTIINLAYQKGRLDQEREINPELNRVLNFLETKGI